MQIIWLRLDIPLVYNMYRVILHEYTEKNIFYMVSEHSNLNHILKKMANITEGSTRK